jgi:hypothetical protein
MEPKFRGKIISALRRLSREWKPKADALNEAKVDKALYQCEICCCYLYEGKSESNYKKYINKYPDITVKKEKPQADHITTIVPIEKDWVWNWDDYIKRLFVPKNGYQILCNFCHKEKTDIENEKRNTLRRK